MSGQNPWEAQGPVGNWPPQVERILCTRAGYLVVPILFGNEKHYPIGAETFSDTTPNAKGIVVQKILQILLTVAGLHQLGTPELKCIKHEKATDVIELMNALHQVYSVDKSVLEPSEEGEDDEVTSNVKAFKQTTLLHKGSLKPSVRSLVHYGPTFNPDHMYRIVASMMNAETTEWVNLAALFLMGTSCANGYLATLRERIEKKYQEDQYTRDEALEEIDHAESEYKNRGVHWEQDDEATGINDIEGIKDKELTRCEKRISTRMIENSDSGDLPTLAEGLDGPARRPPAARDGKTLAYVDDWQKEGVIKPKVEFYILPIKTSGVSIGDDADGEECEEDDMAARRTGGSGAIIAALFIMVIGDPLLDVDFGVQKIIGSVEERMSHQIRMAANGESGAKGANSSTSWTEPFPDVIASDPDPLSLPGMPQVSPENERPPHLSKRHPVRHLTQKAWRNLLSHYLYGPQDLQMAVAADGSDMPLTAMNNPMAPSKFFTMERATRLIEQHVRALNINGLRMSSLVPRPFPTLLHPHCETAPTQAQSKPALVIPADAYKIPAELSTLWKHPHEYRLGDMPFPWITITVCIPSADGLKEVDLSTARAERSQDYAGEYSVENIITEYGLDPNDPTQIALARAMRQTKIEPEITPKKPQWVQAYLEKNGNAITLFRDQNAPAFQTLSGMLERHNFAVTAAPTLPSRDVLLSKSIDDARTLAGPYASSLPKDAYPELTPSQAAYGTTYRKYLATGLMRFDRILRVGGGLPRELEPVVKWWSAERSKTVGGEVVFGDTVSWYDPAIEDSYSQLLIWDEATCNRVFGLTGGPIKVHMVRTAMLSAFGMSEGQVRFHLWIEGLPGTEKSYVVKQLRKFLFPEGVVNDMLTRTAFAMDTGDHSWGVTFYDEAPPILADPKHKDNDQLEPLKAELSDGKRTRGRCGTIKDKSGVTHFVKTITTTITEAVQIMCSNRAMPIDSPVAHRLAIVPATKIHHLAEKIMKQIMASNDPELTKIINGSTNSLYLLSTCCAFTYFLIDAKLLFPMEDIVYKQLGGRLFDYISKKGISTSDNVRVMTKYDAAVKVETIRHMAVTAFMMEGGIFHGKTPTPRRLAKAWSVLGYCNDSIVINNFAIIARQFIDNTASEVIRLIRNCAMPLADGTGAYTDTSFKVKSKKKYRKKGENKVRLTPQEEAALKKTAEATKADPNAMFMGGNPQHIREFATSMMNRYDDPLVVALILNAIGQPIKYVNMPVDNYKSPVLAPQPRPEPAAASPPPPPPQANPAATATAPPPSLSEEDRRVAEAMMREGETPSIPPIPSTPLPPRFSEPPPFFQQPPGTGIPFKDQSTRFPPAGRTIPVKPSQNSWGNMMGPGKDKGGGKKDMDGKTSTYWLSYVNLNIEMSSLTRIISHLLTDTGEVPISKVESILSKWGRTVVEVRTAKIAPEDMTTLHDRWIERFPLPGSKEAEALNKRREQAQGQGRRRGRPIAPVVYPPSDADISDFLQKNVCTSTAFTKVLLENIIYEPGTKCVCVAMASLRSTECDYLNKALQVVYYQGAHVPKKMVWAVDHYSNMPVFSTTAADTETQGKLAAKNGPWIINSTRDIGPDTASIIPGIYSKSITELKTEAAEEVNEVIRNWYIEKHMTPPEGLMIADWMNRAGSPYKEHHEWLKNPAAKQEEIMLRVSEKRHEIRKEYETRCAEKFATLHGNYMAWSNGRPVDLSEMAAYLCWMRHGAPKKITPDGGPLTPTDIVTMAKRRQAILDKRAGPEKNVRPKEVNYPGDVIKEYVKSYIRDGIDLSNSAGVVMEAILDAEEEAEVEATAAAAATAAGSKKTPEEPEADIDVDKVTGGKTDDGKGKGEKPYTKKKGKSGKRSKSKTRTKTKTKTSAATKTKTGSKSRKDAPVTSPKKRVRKEAKKKDSGSSTSTSKTDTRKVDIINMINSDSNLGSLLESVRADTKRRRTSMTSSTSNGPTIPEVPKEPVPTATTTTTIVVTETPAPALPIPPTRHFGVVAGLSLPPLHSLSDISAPVHFRSFQSLDMTVATVEKTATALRRKTPIVSTATRDPSPMSGGDEMPDVVMDG